jgi:hypothetical protein
MIHFPITNQINSRIHLEVKIISYHWETYQGSPQANIQGIELYLRFPLEQFPGKTSHVTSRKMVFCTGSKGSYSPDCEPVLVVRCKRPPLLHRFSYKPVQKGAPRGGHRASEREDLLHRFVIRTGVKGCRGRKIPKTLPRQKNARKFFFELFSTPSFFPFFSEFLIF